jgi:hypothetical protein
LEKEALQADGNAAFHIELDADLAASEEEAKQLALVLAEEERLDALANERWRDTCNGYQGVSAELATTVDIFGKWFVIYCAT